MLEIGSSDVCEKKKNFAVLHYVICMLDNKRDLKILRQKPVILFMMLRDFLNLECESEDKLNGEGTNAQCRGRPQ